MAYKEPPSRGDNAWASDAFAPELVKFQPCSIVSRWLRDLAKGVANRPRVH